MKKQRILLMLLVGVILTPTIAQAAWWNPFSWFENSPEKQPISEISNVSSTQESNAIQEEENASEVKQTTVEGTTSETETLEQEKQAVPTIINQVVDNTEINNLKTEMQSLKTTLASIQVQITNNAATSNNGTSDNTAAYEQILSKLNVLEQKVENLQNQVKDNNYSKLLARVEALEDSAPSKTEDQSEVIKAIIDRVNLLTNDAGVIVSTSVGVQYITPLICDSGSTDSHGNYSSSLECGSLTDLKF